MRVGLPLKRIGDSVDLTLNTALHTSSEDTFKSIKSATSNQDFLRTFGGSSVPSKNGILRLDPSSQFPVMKDMSHRSLGNEALIQQVINLENKFNDNFRYNNNNQS